MALPYPHGSGSGQIAHNSTYDTGNTPGSTGGKFIGFGEEGTSAVANRTHWALSENIDYLYGLLSADIAVPAGVSFVSIGQTSYQVTDDVFSGDSTYPGAAGVSDPEGMLQLYAVLDDQYNELTDADGNEVRVKLIRESTDVTDVYKNGFITNPYLHFHTVDPATGVEVANPYSIPAAQSVRILYGSKGSFESLPTDAFTKFKVQAANEVEAGAFLQDGTKQMTGDFNADGNDLLNVGQMLSVAASALTVRAYTDLHLVGDSALDLKDQFLSSAVSLSETGESTLVGDYTSLVGELNSKTRGAAAIHGTRFRDRTGTIVFTGATGDVAWPTLNYMRNGEAFTVASGSLTATATTEEFLVIDATDTVVKRAIGALTSGDIPVAYYYWDGAATFTYSSDVRWAMVDRSGVFEITVGTTVGCDFPAAAMQAAVYYAGRVGQYTLSNGIPGTVLIRVLDGASWTSTLQITGPMTIRGEGASRTTLTSACGLTDNGIDFNSNAVIVENLSIENASGALTGNAAAFYNAGSYSIFRNVIARDFGTGWLWDTTEDHVLLDKCIGTGMTYSFVDDNGGGFGTPYLSQSVIRDSVVAAWGSGASRGIVMTGEGNRIENTQVIGTSGAPLGSYGIVVGSGCVVTGCLVQMQGAGGQGVGIYYIVGAVPQYQPLTVVENTTVVEAIRGISLEADDSTYPLAMEVRGCAFTDNDTVVYLHDSDHAATLSSFRFINNFVDAATVSVFDASPGAVIPVWLDNNNIQNCTGDIFELHANVGGSIVNNNVSGYGSGGSQSCIVYTAAGTLPLVIEKNYFGNTGAPASSSQCVVLRPCIIANNSFVGSANAYKGVYSSNVTEGIDIHGNVFVTHGLHGVHLARTSGGYYTGSRIHNNRFLNIAAGGAAVRLTDVADVIVSNNEFGAMAAGGILVTGTTYGGLNTQISGNHFSLVQGDNGGSSYGVVVLVGTTGGCAQSIVSDNVFNYCGSTALGAAATQATILCNAQCLGAQITGNKILGLTGGSAASDVSDFAFGIYLGAAGLIANNYLYKNFAVTGAVADTFYGIYADASGIQVIGNQINWTGTATDAHPADVVRGIYAPSGDNMVVSMNVVTGDWVSGATNACMVVDGDNCSIVGNSVSKYILQAGGANGVALGNVAIGTASISWNTTGSNQPSAVLYSGNSALPYQDMNVGAISHA